MKKHISSFFLHFLMFLIVALTGCKKYPDDHKISLQTAKKRFRAHEWFFSKLFINGKDSTMTHLHNILPTKNSTRDLSFKITEGLNYKSDGGVIAFPFYPKPTSAYPDLTSAMSINEKKTVLTMGWPIMNTLIPNTMNSSIWIPIRTTWEITKLTKTDLHIKSTYNNYEVKFEFVN